MPEVHLRALAEPSIPPVPTDVHTLALAEPSIHHQASAEPSTSKTKCDASSKVLQVFKTSTPQVAHNSHLVSSEAIRKQNDIITSIWPTTTSEAQHLFPQFTEMFKKIKSFGLPNFLGAKVTIPSTLNLPMWRKKLSDYHDKEICVFLQYGWPVGYHADTPPTNTHRNHPSATLHPAHVEKFITTKLQHGAMVGQFTSPPFTLWTRCSPLMTRPKKDSTDRRVIINLSYPHGEAVNDGINTVNFFGNDITYSLPTIGDLVALLQQQGQGAYLWKADLARAYCQFRIDPLDTPLLGIKFNGAIYLDLCPSFGCRTSSAACQRVSNTLTFILAKEGHSILAYLDDYASCHASFERAPQGFNAFLNTAHSLGLDLALKKCVAPTHTIDWLGYTINAKDMSVTIPAVKRNEFVKDCTTWLSKRKANKKAIQSLVGRMTFISNCVTQGRRLMGRVLGALRAMAEWEWTTLSDDFRLEVKLFVNYAKESTEWPNQSCEIPGPHRV